MGPRGLVNRNDGEGQELQVSRKNIDEQNTETTV